MQSVGSELLRLTPQPAPIAAAAEPIHAKGGHQSRTASVRPRLNAGRTDDEDKLALEVVRVDEHAANLA